MSEVRELEVASLNPTGVLADGSLSPKFFFPIFLIYIFLFFSTLDKVFAECPIKNTW